MKILRACQDANAPSRVSAQRHGFQFRPQLLGFGSSSWGIPQRFFPSTATGRRKSRDGAVVMNEPKWTSDVDR